MMAGAPGTAAYAAAASILATEGGTRGLCLGAACYVAMRALW
jgi:hypothetical protein